MSDGRYAKCKNCGEKYWFLPEKWQREDKGICASCFLGLLRLEYVKKIRRKEVSVKWEIGGKIEWP